MERRRTNTSGGEKERMKVEESTRVRERVAERGCEGNGVTNRRSRKRKR